jgi:RimJ/RimL family protein N-acetyltransferase
MTGHFFQAVQASCPELDQFSQMADAYQGVENVTRLRLACPDVLHRGIWRGDTLVGSINVWPYGADGAELSYWTSTPHIGQGFATLSVKALAAHAVKQYRWVRAEVDAENKASQRVLKKADYHKIADNVSGLLFKHSRINNVQNHAAEQTAR